MAEQQMGPVEKSNLMVAQQMEAKIPHIDSLEDIVEQVIAYDMQYEGPPRIVAGSVRQMVEEAEKYLFLHPGHELQVCAELIGGDVLDLGALIG